MPLYLARRIFRCSRWHMGILACLTWGSTRRMRAWRIYSSTFPLIHPRTLLLHVLCLISVSRVQCNRYTACFTYLIPNDDINDQRITRTVHLNEWVTFCFQDGAFCIKIQRRRWGNPHCRPVDRGARPTTWKLDQDSETPAYKLKKMNE
jgi:hypothetical protein